MSRAATMFTLKPNAVILIKKMFIVLAIVHGTIFLLHPGRFAKKYSFIDKTDISNHLVPVPISDNITKSLCPLVSPLKSTVFDIKTFQFKANVSEISLGGGWKPLHCVAQHKIAIIIPYRNREDHLKTFLSYMHGFLQAQLIDYQIFVVEQSPKMAFNRALLFNIGYAEVLKRHQIPCFIFHDVDLLPENIENVYGCSSLPRHMSSSVNTLRYQLPYESLFGGVVSLLQAQFQMINGFPNRYFGWGGEDDDLYLRIVNKGMQIIRFSPDVSRYYMLPHSKDSVGSENLIHLQNALPNQDLDGLSNMKSVYELLGIELMQYYTLVRVDLLPPVKGDTIESKASRRDVGITSWLCVVLIYLCNLFLL